MTANIRWGIVGTGTVAGHFAADFIHSQHAELVACCSRNPENAARFARQWGAANAYSRYEDLLADDQVNVVYIAIPHHLHQAYSLQAFDAGKAVLCEKPFTLNAAEAKIIVDAAREKNIFCMEAMWMRCLPLLADIKQRIEAGDIGPIEHIHAEFGYPTPYDPASRFFDIHQAGGSLLDRGIYTIALACHLLGTPSRISGEARIGQTGVDESSCYRLEFPNGARAELCSSLVNYASNAAVITGSKGWIRIHPPFYRPEFVSFYEGKPAAVPAVTAGCDSFKTNKIMQKLRRVGDKLGARFGSGKHQQQAIPGNGYQYEIDEVSRCLQQGFTESPRVPLDDSLAILNIMDELRAQWGLRYPQEN